MLHVLSEGLESGLEAEIIFVRELFSKHLNIIFSVKNLLHEVS